MVTSLVQGLEGKNHKVYFDKYFTNVHLMEDLKEKGVNACVTVKPRRKYLQTFMTSSNMNRGHSETFTSITGISATKWLDKKDVFILTNQWRCLKLKENKRMVHKVCILALVASLTTIRT